MGVFNNRLGMGHFDIKMRKVPKRGDATGDQAVSHALSRVARHTEDRDVDSIFLTELLEMSDP